MRAGDSDSSSDSDEEEELELLARPLKLDMKQ